MQDGEFNMTLRQTRLNLTTMTKTGMGDLKVFLEGDFYESAGAAKTKSFVEEKSGSITSLLRLSGEATALNGIYLATEMLSNAQLLVPFKEKYTASKSKMDDILTSFDDNYDDIKKQAQQFLAFGHGKDAVFEQVNELLSYKDELSIFMKELQINAGNAKNVLSTISKNVKTKSSVQATDLKNQLSASSKTISTLMVIFISSVLIIIIFFIRPIVKRLNVLSRKMDDVRKGDVNCTIPINGHDEITAMSLALERFREDAKRTKELENEKIILKEKSELDKKESMNKLANNFEQRVQGIIKKVVSAATTQSQTAENMSNVINKSSELTQSAATSASQANSNVQSIASATEEMTATSKEISSQVQRSHDLVSESVSKVESADAYANDLTTSANKVTDVVGLISSISEQINLLALNATIESARAGDAGKGFAVVANEVKNLANQTSASIQEIKNVIDKMDIASGNITSSLEDIKQSVNNISESSSNMSSSIEEQSATINDISVNMNSAADGTKEISDNLQEVSVGASKSQTAAEEVLSASNELSEQSEILQEEVKSFLLEIRES